MSMMKRTKYFLTQILLHRAVVHAWKRKLRIQYLLRQAIALDDDRNMKSEVHKSHHRSRHRHHEHQSKHKRRQESSSKTCADDAPTVFPVPSDESGSERCFPLPKEHCDVSGSESPENNVTRKQRQRDDENMRCEVMTISDSDSANGDGDEERAKQKKKRRHKEKKRRKHHSKKQRTEDDHIVSRASEPYRKRDGETDSDHSSDRQHEEPVRVKQEPLSSDEDARHRQRAKDQKQSSDVRDGNGHSNSGRDGLRLDRHIKEEHRDRSSSRERKPRPELLKHSKSDRRNGTSEDYHGHRERRNGRMNGETSSAIKTERDDDSQSRDRDRRRRNNEREDHNRDHRGDSREGPRRIKRERPTEDEREYEWGKSDNRQAANNNPGAPASSEDKKKPDFGLSGKLTEDVNVYNGVVIKYSEPPEARKPKRRWRFYPFKGDETLPTLYLHRQSAFLIGRDRKVADIPVDHPSCSKQHAALQYRLVPFTREDGTKGKRVRPYIIDLDSANGTYVNNKRIEARKYVELMERDVIKFGYSSRDYVLLHEHSKGDEEDDDQNG